MREGFDEEKRHERTENRETTSDPERARVTLGTRRTTERCMVVHQRQPEPRSSCWTPTIDNVREDCVKSVRCHCGRNR